MLREHPVVLRARLPGQLLQPAQLLHSRLVGQRHTELAGDRAHLVVEVAVVRRDSLGDGAYLRVAALFLGLLAARSAAQSSLANHDQQITIRGPQRTPPRGHPVGVLDFGLTARSDGDRVLRGPPVLEHGQSQRGDHRQGDGPSNESGYRGAQCTNLSPRVWSAGFQVRHRTRRSRTVRCGSAAAAPLARRAR